MQNGKGDDYRTRTSPKFRDEYDRIFRKPEVKWAHDPWCIHWDDQSAGICSCEEDRGQ